MQKMNLTAQNLEHEHSRPTRLVRVPENVAQKEDEVVDGVPLGLSL